jgi:hypothetical protein
MDLRYLRIRLTAWRWRKAGRCMNWETLFTAKDISRRVRDRYCRAPTRLRYGEGLVRGSPERSERACAVDIGVLIGLASDMLLFWRRSSM